MIDSSLYHRLSPVSRRFQMRRLFTCLAFVWIVATMAALLLWGMKSSGAFYSIWSLPILLSATLFASLAAAWWSLRDEEDFKEVVEQIETQHPDLDSALLTAVQQQPATANGTLGYLQQQVVRKAVYHGYQNPWAKVVPQWHLLALPLLAAFALFALMGATAGQLLFVDAPTATVNLNDQSAGAAAADIEINGEFEIEPGNTEVERFTSLMVLARFAPDHLPSSAELVITRPDSGETRIPMNKSLDDPIFGARIGSIKNPLNYEVQFDGRSSDSFRVGVFEFPKLVRADAILNFPEYTGLENKLAQDVRRVSAVQGTELRWALTLNKSIESGRLLSSDGEEFPLVVDPTDPSRYFVDMAVTNSVKLKLELVDSDQRKNKAPPTLSIQVLGNKPVDIRQLAPAADTEVSPIEELTLAATFWDEFGVERAGVAYQIIGQTETEVVLAEAIEAKKKHESGHVLAFETLNAQPNQLLTFYFWAEDLDDAGKVRRSVGDIHLVTVRDFESIFRQGQAQPAGGGGGGGGQGGPQSGGAQELAELQKQIVYAIWNLQRREIFKTTTNKFIKDVMVIAESQQSAIDQLAQASQQLPAESKPIVEKIQILQSATVGHLEDAAKEQDVKKLADALETSQSAFQAMLALRSIENQVSQQQSQQQGGGGGGNNRSRQQMQQLQLENDENRYQNEQLASEREETGEQRENRQVLSRLRELARRQNDLNKRIKELQTALEEAETEEEREEIEKQLKRLRDEQQQILRDAEELQERMENEQNQSRMSEQSEKLEQARENARRSSEALEQGDTTKAAAEGTRALRDMEELRDEFQNRTSGQFDEQMQRMRSEAREIEKRQQEISDAMQNGENERPKANRLTDDSEQEAQLDKQLEEQRDRVERIREEMRETIEEAETFEPLLAEKLYDTYRDTLQDSPADALDSAARSMRQGFEDDAQREERRAARGIENLRKGIDEAAESVLGDETESLRRADRELQRLTRQLEGEVQRGDPNSSNNSDQQSPDGQGGNRQPEDDEERDGSGNNQQTEQNQEPRNGQGNADQEGEGQQRDSDNENPNGRGQGGDIQKPSDNPQGQGSGGNNPPEDRQRQDRNRSNGPPSLTRQNNQRDTQTGVGANPEINFDRESWADPITGDDDFRQWSDRMRDVEEMVADPEMRAEAARIRENARSIRRDIKRHSTEPNWELIRLKVINPMVKLQDRVHEELIRRSGDKTLVPIDRDPVPAEFENAVDSYFEKLGRGQ